jgi:hypothetical protein
MLELRSSSGSLCHLSNVGSLQSFRHVTGSFRRDFLSAGETVSECDSQRTRGRRLFGVGGRYYRTGIVGRLSERGGREHELLSCHGQVGGGGGGSSVKKYVFRYRKVL